MRKLTILFFVTAILAGGCDFINKINPFAESVDTLDIYRQRQDSIRRVALLERQQEEARRERAAAERSDSLMKVQEAAEQSVIDGNRYHLVVGAFKTQSYANGFHETISNQGHDSRILLSGNQFHLVTIKSLDNYRSAVNELRALQDKEDHFDAWLYIGD